MQTLFGFDLSTAQKVIVASVVILVLLALLGLFVRQIQGGRLRMKGQSGGRARQPRLGVVDAHNLDRQRQLILIRRDNVEHLIMIGGASDVVVETNIVRSGARTTPAPVDYAMTERPQAFDTLVPPEPARQDAVAVAQPRPDLLPPLPPRHSQVVPPLRPAQGQVQAEAALAGGAAAVLVPAAMAAAASATAQVSPAAPSPTPNVQPPSFARDPASSPAASAVELDSMARQLEEALKRPFSAVRPSNSQNERPSERSSEPPTVQAPAQVPDTAPRHERVVEHAARAVEAPPLPVPSPPAPPETSGRPVALPADVAAELELALGLRPERTAPPPPVTAPRPVFVPEAMSVAEPVPQPPSHEPAVQPPDGHAQVTEARPAEIEPDEPEDDMLDEAAAEVRADEPEAEPEPEAAAAAKPPAAEPEPDKKPAAIDPFSVDAIEAEFARLLGRDPKAKT